MGTPEINCLAKLPGNACLSVKVALITLEIQLLRYVWQIYRLPHVWQNPQLNTGIHVHVVCGSYGPFWATLEVSWFSYFWRPEQRKYVLCQVEAQIVWVTNCRCIFFFNVSCDSLRIRSWPPRTHSYVSFGWCLYFKTFFHYHFAREFIIHVRERSCVLFVTAGTGVFVCLKCLHFL